MRTCSLPPAEVWICADPAALGGAAAEEMARVARDAVARQGRGALALAGGSTPRASYAALARHPLPWEVLDLFFSDERMVPPDHPESNCRMAREALFSRAPIPHAHLHPVPTHLAPEAAARSYEEEIRRALGVGTGMPRFDLVLLGLGADGHTASLFPGSTALDETSALVASNWVTKLDAHRITFTLPLLNLARQVMFLVAGSEKAEVVREVLRPKPGGSEHPAARVRPGAGRLLWLLDEAAAARLA